MQKKKPEREVNRADRVFSSGAVSPPENPFAVLAKLKGDSPLGSELDITQEKAHNSFTPQSTIAKKMVTIQRSAKGHGGKTVTTARSEAFSEQIAKEWLTKWKKILGVGGTVERTIEGWTVQLQGDVRDRLEGELVKAGAKVKRSGG
ncbi:MAG: hypothetical protein OEM52_08485 [bacterium]|nr:hypothetical protein [bacterium]